MLSFLYPPTKIDEMGGGTVFRATTAARRAGTSRNAAAARATPVRVFVHVEHHVEHGGDLLSGVSVHGRWIATVDDRPRPPDLSRPLLPF